MVKQAGTHTQTQTINSTPLSHTFFFIHAFFHTPDGSTAYIVSNGIISRTFVANATTGLLSTVSLAVLSGAGAGEKLKPLACPEALVSINGVGVLVGG